VSRVAGRRDVYRCRASQGIFSACVAGWDLDVDACHEVSLLATGSYFSTNEKIDLEADHASSAVLRGVATPVRYQCLSAGQNAHWDLWEID
jgi:hypothetical protein